jgi:hypothetical protein
MSATPMPPSKSSGETEASSWRAPIFHSLPRFPEPPPATAGDDSFKPAKIVPIPRPGRNLEDAAAEMEREIARRGEQRTPWNVLSGSEATLPSEKDQR